MRQDLAAAGCLNMLRQPCEEALRIEVMPLRFKDRVLRMSLSNKAQLLLRVYGSLSRIYGKARKARKENPFEQLVLCILAHRSSETAAQEALDRLTQEYVDWNEVRVSAVNDLGEMLSRSGIDSATAHVLKSALDGIFNKQYSMNAEFLRDAKPEDARRMLSELDSLPEQIISATLLTSYDNLPVPVDEEMARVIRRLGVVKADVKLDEIDKLLRTAVPRREAYSFFRVFTLHAYKLCQPVSPDCASCTVRRMCSYGTAALAEARAQRASARRTAPSAPARPSRARASKPAEKATRSGAKRAAAR